MNKSASDKSSQSPHLRKLIRCKPTQAFLTPGDTWTHDIHNAIEVTVPDALETVRAKFPQHDLELYYSFGDNARSPFDFTVSLR